jgi:hypothetical protein
MKFMLLVSFLKWWYGSGWMGAIDSLKPRLANVADEFSLGQLLQTLFAPWKRIITYPGASISERFQASLDNMFSRCVGFVVRVFVIIAAIIVLLFVLVVTCFEIMVWPLLPLLVPGSIIFGAL